MTSAAVVAAGGAGCTGTGSVHIIPFVRNDLGDDEPVVGRFPNADRCAWFLDEEGRMNIVLEYENIPLFGRFTRTSWAMHMRLDQPPAGRSARYTVNRDQVRALYSGGIDHRRLSSRWGVVVLNRVSADRFRGRFQVAVTQQQFSVLGGWSSGPLLIAWGEFETSRDDAYARRRAVAFDDRWNRPASRPTTRTTGAPAGSPIAASPL